MNGRDSHDRNAWERLQDVLGLSAAPRRKPLPTKVLVVTWGVSSATISVYERTTNSLRCHDSFEFAWNEAEQHSYETIGGGLGRELLQRGISVREVVVSVPRRFVVLKNLDLPPTPPTTIADVVHLQCENLFPVSRATLEIDFLQHDVAAEADTSILVVAVPKPLIQLVLDALRHAGLKPLALGVAELGIPFLSPTNPTGDLQLDLLASGNKFEFLVSRNQLPVISHAGQAPDLDAERMRYVCSTMNRLVHAARQRLPELSTTRIHAYGDFDDATAIEMRSSTKVPIEFHCAVTVKDVKEHALLAACLQPASSIDFLNPRKPSDPALRFRRQSAVYAAAAVLILALVGIPLLWNHYRLDRQLAKIKQQKAVLAEQVERLLPLEKTWKKLVAFERSRVDYAVELQEILSRFKPSELMHLEHLEISESANGGPTVMRFHGRIRDRETWTNLTNELLVAAARYRLRAPLLEASVGDDHYAFRFTLELELEKGSGLFSSSYLSASDEALNGRYP